ncbi:MAG: peptide chain release factor 2 [Clostridia bacterium]
MKKSISLLGQSLRVEDMKKEAESLEEQTSHEKFWSDMENSQRILQRIKFLNTKLGSYNGLVHRLEDLYVMLELYQEEKDQELEMEINESLAALRTQHKEFRLFALLNGPHDKNNAILTLHAGAGGTEAQDWVEMLLRMYTRWAETRNYRSTVTDILYGDEAGIKSVTVRIEGEHAYGYLKEENGVHRLVRISPFDSSGRRHTSFASVEVIPEVGEDMEVNIRPEDLRIDTFRSSGAGGQHVNTTDSAIRITHLPTNIVVACQSERSQHQNKDTAMRMLLSKLLELKERENMERIEDLKGIQMEIAWGSQIRSYVFCPYTMVKDHRTNHETGDVTKVMDGEIDEFINASLSMRS